MVLRPNFERGLIMVEDPPYAYFKIEQPLCFDQDPIYKTNVEGDVMGCHGNCYDSIPSKVVLETIVILATLEMH